MTNLAFTARRGILALGVALLTPPVGACAGSPDKAPAAQPPMAADPTPTPTAQATAPGDTLTTLSGIKYTFVKHGSGPRARSGQTVTVHYVGTLTNGNEFDSSRKGNQPFEFTLGQHQVIDGWEEAVALMHIGDRAMFTIPPKLAYGARGMPPVIPPNATLIFDIELLDTK